MVWPPEFAWPWRPSWPPREPDVQRAIDAPDQVWSDRRQAAAWLGLGEVEFDREVRLRPHLLPFSGAGKGQTHRWHWMTLVVYSWLREHGFPGEPAPQVPEGQQ